MLRWFLPYALAALVLFPNPAAAQAPTTFTLETSATFNTLFLTNVDAPFYRFVRWNGGNPIVVVANTPTYNDNVFTDPFVCYAPLTRTGTGDVLCMIRTNLSNHIDISLAGNTANLSWQAPQPGIQYSIAIVPLGGGNPTIVQTTNTFLQHNTGGRPTCYAVLYPNQQSPVGSPVCAFPGSAT
jgi:hypothetical protein